MSGKRAKADRRRSRLESMEVAESSSGEELVLREYSDGGSGDIRHLETENASFEDAFALTFMGPCPSVGYYRDRNPVCGSPDCAIVFCKYPQLSTPEVPLPFRIGIGAGEGGPGQRGAADKGAATVNGSYPVRTI